MTIQVVKETDSLSKWMKNLNGALDAAIGQFYIDPSIEYPDLNVTMTGGSYRDQSGVTVTVPETSLELSGSGIWLVGVDLNNEGIDFVEDGEEGERFVPCFKITSSASKILFIEDLRINQYVSTFDSSQTANSGLRGVADVDALRDFTGISPDIRVWLKAVSVAGDGGQGTYRYVDGASAGTYVDDGYDTIVPTGGDGSAAWIRENHSKILVKSTTSTVEAIHNSFNAESEITGNGTFSIHNSFRDSFSYKGTTSISTVNGFTSVVDLSGTGTVNQRSGFSVYDYTGSSVVGVQIGVYIANLSKGSVNYSLKSEGAGAILSHAGAATFGVTSHNASYGISYSGSITTGAIQSGINSDGIAPTSASTSYSGIRSFPGTIANGSSYTIPDVFGIDIGNGTKGSNSTITRFVGVNVRGLTNGTNNRAFVSSVNANANSWGLYFSGSAQNHLAGNLGIGSSAQAIRPPARLYVDGSTATVPQVRLGSGTLTTTPINGALENDGEFLWFTLGDVRQKILFGEAASNTATSGELIAGDVSKLVNADIITESLEEVSLTDATTISVNGKTFINGVVLLAGNRTLGNMTDKVVGRTYRLRVQSSSATPRNLVLDSEYIAATGLDTTALTNTTGGRLLLSLSVIDSTTVVVSGVRY